MFIWHTPIIKAFRRGPLISKVTHLSYINRIRGGIPPRIIFHAFLVYGTLIVSPFYNHLPLLGLVNCPE